MGADLELEGGWLIDVRDRAVSLARDAEHLVSGARRLCFRRHLLLGEGTAGLVTCPVVSPWPGQDERICGADLYPGFLVGGVGDDPQATIRGLIEELHAVTAERDAALGSARPLDR